MRRGARADSWRRHNARTERLAPAGNPHPARLVPIAFLIAIAIGTALLMLPMPRPGPAARLSSPLCSPHLGGVRDRPAHRRHADLLVAVGHVVILALFQVGGFGIMSGATLLGLLAGRRLRFSARLVARAERGTLDISRRARRASADPDRHVRRRAVRRDLAHPCSTTAMARRGTGGLDRPFYSVSAFTNAGFSTYSDSLVGFRSDALFLCR